MRLKLDSMILRVVSNQNGSMTDTRQCIDVPSQIAQLRHEVSMRDDLLHFYTTTTEESEPTSATSTP